MAGRLWVGSGTSLVVCAFSVVLYANSNAIDCHPSCSWDQQLFGYLMLVSATALALLTLAAIAATFLRWRSRRSARG